MTALVSATIELPFDRGSLTANYGKPFDLFANAAKM
jgi:hypothetical protein